MRRTLHQLTGVVALWVVYAPLAYAANPPAAFDYVAEGLIGLPDSNKQLPWKLAGRVSAATREEAVKLAEHEVDDRLRDKYPATWVEDRSGRTLVLTLARNLDPTSDRTTLTLQVTCLGEYVYEKDTLVILVPILSERRVIRTFPVRLVVSDESGNKTFPATIISPTRGRLNESTATFEVWAGEFGRADAAREFTVRLLQPNLPDPNLLEAPRKLDPTNPNDGYFEVGAFKVRLSRRGDHLAADWTPVANAKAAARREAPRGGVLTNQFYLKQPTTIRYSVIGTAVREGDVAAFRLAADQVASAEDEEMRQKLVAAGLNARVFIAKARGRRQTAGGKEGLCCSRSASS